MAFGQNNGAMGLKLLQQIQGMQKGGGVGGEGGLLFDARGGLGLVDMMKGGANPQGIIPRMMAGNPGGLLGAILNRNAPVNPGAPPPAGSPDYVEGGAGPMAGGGAAPMGGMGMLSKLLGQGGMGGAMGGGMPKLFNW
jgi:hypothetical protein